MKRFEVGKMYYYQGFGFDPVKIVSRSKSGGTVTVNNGRKTFRRKVRYNEYNDCEYAVMDNQYQGWMRDEVSIWANSPVEEVEQRKWEEHEPGYKS